MIAFREVTAAAVLALAAISALAAPAAAQEETGDRDDLVVLTGRVDVAEDETFDTVVIFDGPSSVAGTVRGAVVSFNGPVDVTGTVQEDVVSFNGPVTIRSGAIVQGDVISRSAVTVEEGATVDGEIRRDIVNIFSDPFPFFARFLAWVALTASLLALGLLFVLLAPRAADAVAVAWRTGMGPSIGWGLILAIGLPIFGVLIAITVIGIPLAVMLLFALGLLYGLGYVAGTIVLGRLVIKPPSSMLLAFLLGLLVLRLIALVPILGGLVGAIVTVIGFGSIAVAIWRARRPARLAAPVTPAAP